MRYATTLRCCLLSLLAASATGCVTHRVLESSETVHEKLGEQPVRIDSSGYVVHGDTVSVPMQLHVVEQHRDTTTYQRTVEYHYDSYLASLDLANDPITSLIAFPTSVIFDVVGFVFSAPFEYLAGATEDLRHDPDVRSYEQTRSENLPDQCTMMVRIDGEPAGEVTYSNGRVNLALGRPALRGLAQGHTSLRIDVFRDCGQELLGVNTTFSMEQMLAMGEAILPTTLDERAAAWQEVLDQVPETSAAVRIAIVYRLQPLQNQLAFIHGAKQRAERLYELDTEIAVLRTTADSSPDQRRKTAALLIERSGLYAGGFWLQGKVEQDPLGARDDLDAAARIASNLDDLELLETVLKCTDLLVANERGGR